MPEPDFAALAYEVASLSCESVGLLDEEIRWHPDALDDTIAILKKLWNARGAADIALIDQTLGTLMGIQAAGPYVKNLDRALRTLDR